MMKISGIKFKNIRIGIGTVFAYYTDSQSKFEVFGNENIYLLITKIKQASIDTNTAVFECIVSNAKGLYNYSRRKTDNKIFHTVMTVKEDRFGKIHYSYESKEINPPFIIRKIDDGILNEEEDY